MTETPLANVAHTIQLSVAPVFLLTALGTFLGVLSTRLGRIVDRSRAVRERLRTASAPDKAALGAELDLLRRRRHLVNLAIGSGVAAAFLVCTIISALFVGSILSANLPNFVAVLFVGAMLAFTLGLLLFLREVLLAATNITFDH